MRMAHPSWSAKIVSGEDKDPQRQFLATPQELIPVMDRRNIHLLRNLTAGFGCGLDEVIARFNRVHPGRVCSST
jgi:hypothetical protein